MILLSLVFILLTSEANILQKRIFRNDYHLHVTKVITVCAFAQVNTSMELHRDRARQLCRVLRCSRTQRSSPAFGSEQQWTLAVKRCNTVQSSREQRNVKVSI